MDIAVYASIANIAFPDIPSVLKNDLLQYPNLIAHAKHIDALISDKLPE